MEEEKSKSQQKREAQAIKALAVELTQLSNRERAQIPLPDNVCDALVEARSIKSNAAKSRQCQMIAKLLRKIEDLELIIKAFDKLKTSKDLVSAEFHSIEQWRTRLLSEDDRALTEFLDQYACADVQQLRQLIRKAKAQAGQEMSGNASKSLFRLLREIIT